MTTLSDWEQRNLDAGRLVGKLAPAATPRQGQAGLTSERQRYVVLPGVKGHKMYRLWDTRMDTLVSEGDSRQDVMLVAWLLNTMPGAGG